MGMAGMFIPEWNNENEEKNKLRIAVGTAQGPSRMIINDDSCDKSSWELTCNGMNIPGWSHHTDFYAFKSELPGTIRIAVGEAQGPHRMMFNHASLDQSKWNTGQKMDVQGWTHKMEFWAYPTKQPGTMRIAVGQANNPHRMAMNISIMGEQAAWNCHWKNKMDIQGWDHHTEFWVYPCRDMYSCEGIDWKDKVLNAGETRRTWQHPVYG